MNLFQLELLIFAILILLVIPVVLLDRTLSLETKNESYFPFGLFYGILVLYSIVVSFHFVLWVLFKLGASFFSLFI